MIIWKSRKKSWNWIALEFRKMGTPFMFHVSRNYCAKQWFAYINVFPVSIAKNNSQFWVGLSSVFFAVGINFHLNFTIRKLKRNRHGFTISLYPFGQRPSEFEIEYPNGKRRVLLGRYRGIYK